MWKGVMNKIVRFVRDLYLNIWGFRDILEELISFCNGYILNGERR